jgi:hypothetical protein
VSNSTDKRTHRPPPRGEPAERPPQVTAVRYTLRSVTLPEAPEWGAGRAGRPPGHRCEVELTWATDVELPTAGVARRVTFHLDGEPFPVTVERDRGSDATWLARGTVLLRNGPSGPRPVTFEVVAYGAPEILPTWTTVAVATLLRNGDLWLAP